jgi:hypothetical protein
MDFRSTNMDSCTRDYKGCAADEDNPVFLFTLQHSQAVLQYVSGLMQYAHGLLQYAHGLLQQEDT